MDLKSESDFYVGCRALAPVAAYFGLSIDKFNFLFCQIAFLLFSFPYRVLLHPSRVSPTARHIVALTVGLVFGYFCFGYQILHLVAQATLVYMIINYASPESMHKIVLAVGMGYLSAIHIMRQIYDYGGYHLDVTGPLMVATQKVTSIAFNLHDGLTEKKDIILHPEQRRQMISRMPSPLEFYSYVLHYHTLMCGPLVFFNDYMDFIKGKQFLRHSVRTGLRGHPTAVVEPSPTWATLQKLSVSFMSAASIVYLLSAYPIEYIKQDDFLYNRNRLWQMLYIIWATSLHRHRYYHAWTLGEAICNAAGFGFNGYTSDKKARWNLLSNVDIVTIETSTSLRELIIAWNKSTQTWLRTVSYERVRRHRTQLTFILSAMWHGFYPGYYLTFGTGTLFTLGARAVRRSVRPLFQGSRRKQRLYDLITCLATRVAVAYMVFPFLLLDFHSSFRVYRHFGFVGHVMCLLAMYVLPRVLPPPPRSPSRCCASPTSPHKAVEGSRGNADLSPQNDQETQLKDEDEDEDETQQPHNSESDDTISADSALEADVKKSNSQQSQVAENDPAAPTTTLRDLSEKQPPDDKKTQ
ncbi:lysophospholipid acyltransferase 6 [Dermacentor andersoni]|uniref:lysophospholipid acyltransferase 6 n=1 Tax=Dermacentor andersoni TaxID=34620 RepID=UPI0021557D2C|nr:lysophospholipid acyltransferase 6-like [Dermacentor andersoni]